MTRIVTTTYRYKPPPKRKGRKLAEITGPAVVTPQKRAALRPIGGMQSTPAAPLRPMMTGQPRRLPLRGKKSAIVTAKKPGAWSDAAPDMTPEAARSPLPCAALRCFRRSPDGQ